MKNIFILAGFQRSGSTFLSHLLNSHPQILMNSPISPEPKFFINSSISNSDISTYLSDYFNASSKYSWLGDKSVSYIENEMALKNFKDIFPQGKLILILRNPVNRAISNYFFSKRNNLENRTLEEVFIKKKATPELKKQISSSPFNYLEKGNYTKYINTALKYFRIDEVKFYCLEELLENLFLLNDVTKFLEIAPFEFRFVKIRENQKNSGRNVQSIPGDVTNELKLYYKESVEDLKRVTGLSLNQWDFNI